MLKDIKEYINSDSEIVNNFDFNFDVEQKNGYIQNQNGVANCWIFASFNTIESIVSRRTKKNLNEIRFSANYISYYDYFEKVSNVFKIFLEDSSVDIIDLINKNINYYGTFLDFRYLVNKYGIMQKDDMKETPNYKNYNLMIKYLKIKVYQLIEKLDEYKKNHSTEECNIYREKLLEEIKDFLTAFLGVIPKTTRITIEGEKATFTSLEFKEKILGSELEEYVLVSDINIYKMNPTSFKHQSGEFSKNVIVLNIETIKSAVKRSLDYGDGCFFASNSKGYKDDDTDTITEKVYDYFEFLRIKKPSKQILYDLDFLAYEHAMCIVGYEKEDIEAFKVEDTHGLKSGNYGYYVMDKNFFENNILYIAVNKKYIMNKEVL